MSDLTTVKAAPAKLTLDGKNYPLPMLSLLEIRDLQGWINRTYPNPLNKLSGSLDGLPEAIQLRLVLDAQKQLETWTPPAIGSKEADQHLQTVEGLCEICELMLKKGSPDLSDVEIEQVLGQIGEDQLTNVFGLAFGVTTEVTGPKDEGVEAGA